MGMRTTVALGIIAGLAVSTAAYADRIDTFVFENADGVDVSGLDIWIDAIDGGTFIDLVFHNDSQQDSFVTSLYIEATEFTSQGFENMMILTPQPNGVLYGTPGTPANPPGSIDSFTMPWMGTLFAASAEPPPANTGIDPGESLTIRADYNGITFDDVIENLASPDAFRFALHIQGLGDGGASSVWSVSQPVPEPAAVAVIAMAVLAPRRRR